MTLNTYITSALTYPRLNDTQIRQISGALVNKLYIDQPVPVNQFADIVYEESIQLNKLPIMPLIKMAKEEHVDAFFEKGLLRLGTFSDYSKFDHEEIGDKTEGSFILVAHNPDSTVFYDLASGFNNYIFCCYEGAASKSCIERFGYNAGYEVTDPINFSIAIQEKIHALNHQHAKCVYSKDKVIVSTSIKHFNPMEISHQSANIINAAKYFVKPVTYSHQNEFRFIWEMPDNINEPLIIECPNAVKYCKKIE